MERFIVFAPDMELEGNTNDDRSLGGGDRGGQDRQQEAPQRKQKKEKYSVE